MTAGYFEVSDFSKLPSAPKVSIVVLAYRHERFLAEAVESLASQRTDYSYEIVIGEDASPDKTRDVALALQRAYPHLVRVLCSCTNRGMNGNFRLIIAHCRGDYLAGCEGDDFWIDEDKLQRQISALEEMPNVDMAFTRGYRLEPDGSRKPDWDYGPTSRIVSPQELFSGFGWIVPSASVVMRAPILKNLPLWLDEAPVGDVFHLMAGSARGGAWYEPDYTVCYRIAHATSFTVTHAGRSRTDRINFVETALSYIARTCEHYGVPPHHLSDRVNDYRLQLARDMRAEYGWRASLGAYLSIDAGFLAKAVVRRLSRFVRSKLAVLA